MGRMIYSFQFPPNKRADSCNAIEQARKANEESLEVLLAIAMGETAGRVCEETYDLITAAEGILRKFPDEVQDAAYARVLEKNMMRGDWENVHER